MTTICAASRYGVHAIASDGLIVRDTTILSDSTSKLMDLGGCVVGFGGELKACQMLHAVPYEDSLPQYAVSSQGGRP